MHRCPHDVDCCYWLDSWCADVHVVGFCIFKTKGAYPWCLATAGTSTSHVCTECAEKLLSRVVYGPMVISCPWGRPETLLRVRRSGGEGRPQSALTPGLEFYCMGRRSAFSCNGLACGPNLSAYCISPQPSTPDLSVASVVPKETLAEATHHLHHRQRPLRALPCVCVHVICGLWLCMVKSLPW